MEEDTLVMRTEAVTDMTNAELAILALDLAAKLWPLDSTLPVVLVPGEWERLRAVLLRVPDLAIKAGT
jgi:hypothetical protein